MVKKIIADLDDGIDKGDGDGEGNHDYIDEAREEQRDYLNDGLSQYILEAFHAAKEHRDNHNVEETIAKCLRNYRGVYSTEEKAKFDGIDVFRNITGMLCRTANDWLEDSYAQVDDKPWTIEPTPSPNLPKRIKDALNAAIEFRFTELVQSGAIQNMSQADRYDVVRALKQQAEAMAFEEAAKAIKGMSKKIEDEFVDANWVEEFAKFRQDLVVYPTAVLKGPVVRIKRMAEWDGDKIVSKDKAVKVVERVNCIDVFPSPDSTTPQDGESMIERMRMTRSALVAAKDLPNFSKKAIDLVLLDSPEGVDDDESGDANTVAHLEIRDNSDPSIYLVYDFHGRVSGRKILSWLQLEGEAIDAQREGAVVDISEMETLDLELTEIDPYDTYEINAWLCGGKVIHVMMDATPLGIRPYQATSYSKVPGSFWGDSVATLLDSLQTELNAAARARVFNMGVSSGPMVEIDVNRLGDEERPEQVEPWRIFFTSSGAGQGGQPAVRFYQADSNAAELTAVMEEIWTKAHDLAGLPPHTRGVNDGAPRTLGAFSLQYNAATKGIKRVLANVDRDVLTPIVRGYYNFNMFYDDDKTIKADAQVKALGVVGLLRKEQRESRPIETITQIAPLLQDKPQALEALVIEFVKARGYDPAELGLGQGDLVSGLGPPSGPATDAPVGPQAPKLDGRSGSAEGAINATQIPIGG